MTIKWIETTEARYDEMLGVLPPAATDKDWGFSAFQVGEPMNHTDEGYPTFATFKAEGGKYYESDDALTFRQFKAEFKGAEYYYGD